MRALKLGEHGDISTYRVDSGYMADVRYRAWTGSLVRLRSRGKSKAEAQRNLTQALREALEGLGSGEFTKASKFEAGWYGWHAMFSELVDRGRRSPTTLDLYDNVSKRIILPALGDLRLGELTPPLLDRFLRTVLTDKGPSTAKLCRSVLSNVCGWLVRQGGLAVNPVRDLTPIEVSDEAKVARALTVDEVRRWLAALDANEFARRHDLPELARFQLATGLRIGEAVGVTWADLDLDNGTVMIERTIVPVRGHGLIAKRVKSKTSERPLLLPAWCVELLKARRVRMAGFEGPVFPDSKGGWRDRGNVGKAIRRVREEAGFDWLTTHTYRKTVATELDHGGATARAIADQLGHSRVSMTQDRYMGRKVVNVGNRTLLDSLNPDAEGGDSDAK